MANYTTLVRTLCESKSTTDSTNIVDIINNVSPKIFEKYPIFDENHRNELNLKILRHFYFCEIGFETVGLWVEMLNRRMWEIMPAMNEMYKTNALKYDIFNNIDYTETLNGSQTQNAQSAKQSDTSGEIKNSQKAKISGQTQSSEKIDYRGGEKSSRTDNGENTDTGTATTTRGENTNSQTGKTDKYSNTPQGNLASVANDSYLTEYRKIDDNTTQSAESSENATSTNKNVNKLTSDEIRSFDNRTDNKSGNGSTSQTSESTNATTTKDNSTASESLIKNVENAEIKTVKGKNNNQSYMEMIAEYRQNIINIDYMIIDKLKDLFMTIY